MLRSLSAIALFAFVVSLGMTSGCGKDDAKGGPNIVTPDPAMKDMKIKMKPGTGGGGENKEAKGGKAE